MMRDGSSKEVSGPPQRLLRRLVLIRTCHRGNIGIEPNKRAHSPLLAAGLASV